jgi:hypothetical protein
MDKVIETALMPAPLDGNGEENQEPLSLHLDERQAPRGKKVRPAAQPDDGQENGNPVIIPPVDTDPFPQVQAHKKKRGKSQ